MLLRREVIIAPVVMRVRMLRQRCIPVDLAGSVDDGVAVALLLLALLLGGAPAVAVNMAATSATVRTIPIWEALRMDPSS